MFMPVIEAGAMLCYDTFELFLFGHSALLFQAVDFLLDRLLMCNYEKFIRKHDVLV